MTALHFTIVGVWLALAFAIAWVFGGSARIGRRDAGDSDAS